MSDLTPQRPCELASGDLKRLLRRGGVDARFHFSDVVGGEASLLGVLANCHFVRRDVDAVDFVSGNETLHPLNLRTDVADHSARLLRDGLQLFGFEFAGARKVVLDYVFWHGGDCTSVLSSRLSDTRRSRVIGNWRLRATGYLTTDS